MSRVFNRVLILIALSAALFAFFWPKERSVPQPVKDSGTEQSVENLPVDNDNRAVSIRGAAIHFPDLNPPVPKTVQEEKPLKAEPAVPQFTTELKYVSSVVSEGKKSWFFKNTSTDRIYELAPGLEAKPWSWVSEESDYFVLKKNDTICKVKK